MNNRIGNIAKSWMTVSTRFLPFADAATDTLPMKRLCRLSLFQVTAGIALVLLNGTLNRVMVVELAIPTWLVSLMIALPLLIAPMRALIGHRSDNHRSLLGWRRVPYIWMGTLLQFGGLAILPFALLVLSEVNAGPPWMGLAAVTLAFLLVGIGMHTSQTAGLALATDLAPDAVRPRVVALLYVMLLIGMVISSLVFSALLRDFSPLRLIQVIQGAAVVTFALNIAALWKQEARNPQQTAMDREVPTFQQSWQVFRKQGRSMRLMLAIAIGTAGFSMQDVLLEPYGGQILGLSVSATTMLTAILVIGMLGAFAVASKLLGADNDPIRIAGSGIVAGIFAFALVVLSGPLESATMFRIGTFLIGFGGGLFAVGTLTSVMAIAPEGQSGIALGVWGAVQTCAIGIAIGLGGAIRDTVSEFALAGALGPALTGQVSGYVAVYHIELILLFTTLIIIGPLVRHPDQRVDSTAGFGLSGFPG